MTVAGTVISSADNQPIVGANIYVEGTNVGTTTDAGGNYKLTVPASAKTVTVSFLGYDTKKISVRDIHLFKLITLADASNKLEDVVVVGFGVQKKESLVGAVQSVKPSDLQTSSSNLSTSFSGKIAGVIAVQKSGEPGADGANFWIRGISTFGSGQSPLLILDGVEITNQMLNNIPPETIESFSVLKDATATALYGSRGANGVMIITTKNGRDSEKMTINLRAEFGASAPTRVPKVADGITYMETFNEARTTRGEKPYYSNEKIMGTKLGLDPYVYPNVDWYDMLFKDCTFNQNFNFNMTGGAKKIDYFLNASVYNENGIMRKPEASKFDTNINAQKYLFQANVSADATKTTRVSLKMNTQLHYRHAPIQSVSDLFAYAMTGMPCEFPATLPGEESDTFVRFGTSERLEQRLLHQPLRPAVPRLRRPVPRPLHLGADRQPEPRLHHQGPERNGHGDLLQPRLLGRLPFVHAVHVPADRLQYRRGGQLQLHQQLDQHRNHLPGHDARQGRLPRAGVPGQDRLRPHVRQTRCRRDDRLPCRKSAT
ncbi:MAG: SusC/RagA family TonB-linked outer membrane protein [Alistipes shahii]